MDYLGRAHFLLGLNLRAQRKFEEAVSSFQALQTIAETARAKTQDKFWLSWLAAAHMQIGYSRLRQGSGDARQPFEAGQKIMDELVALEPGDVSWTGDRAAMMMGLGAALVANRQPDDGLRWLTQAETLYAFPPLMSFATIRSDAIANKQYLIDAYLQKRSVQAARGACEKGRELRDGGPPIRPDNQVFWEQMFAWNLISCADVAAAEGNRAAEREQVAEAVHMLRKLVDMVPGHAQIRKALEEAERRLCDLTPKGAVN